MADQFHISDEAANEYHEGKGLGSALRQRKAGKDGKDVEMQQPLVGSASVMKEMKRNTVWERNYPSYMDSATTYLLGRSDSSEAKVTSRNFWGAMAINFIAVLFGAWVFSLFATMGTIVQQGGAAILFPLNFILLLANAFTQGIGMWLAFVFVGDISADFNPMILLAEFFMPHFRKEWGDSWGRATVVMLVLQLGAFGGFVMGAASTFALELIAPINAGTPAIITSNSRAFFAETIIAVLFGWAYFTSSFDPRRIVQFGNRPMFLGFAWMGCVLLVGLYTGAAGNFWRHLAPALITNTWVPATDWIYYAGNATGIVGIALLWFFVFRRTRTQEA